MFLSLSDWQPCGGKINIEYSRLKPNVELVVYPDFDHVCCWEDEWTEILRNFSTLASGN